MPYTVLGVSFLILWKLQVQLIICTCIQIRAVRLIGIEIKSWFELARFLNCFINTIFFCARPQPPAVCYRPNCLNWAREQNRPGIQTDSMLKKQGRWVQNRIRAWWPKKMHVARCFVGFDYSHIYIYIYIYSHMSALETCYNFLGKV